MGREADLSDLEEAERRVLEGNMRIAKQEGIIEELEQRRLNASQARAVLKDLLDAQALREQDLDRIRAKLVEG